MCLCVCVHTHKHKHIKIVIGIDNTHIITHTHLHQNTPPTERTRTHGHLPEDCDRDRRADEERLHEGRSHDHEVEAAPTVGHELPKQVCVHVKHKLQGEEGGEGCVCVV